MELNSDDSRLFPEGDMPDDAFYVGDDVEYGGNWDFVGEVTRIHKRTVWVSNGEETKSFDYRDLKLINSSSV